MGHFPLTTVFCWVLEGDHIFHGLKRQFFCGGSLTDVHPLIRKKGPDKNCPGFKSISNPMSNFSESKKACQTWFAGKSTIEFVDFRNLGVIADFLPCLIIAG